MTQLADQLAFKPVANAKTFKDTAE